MKTLYEDFYNQCSLETTTLIDSFVASYNKDLSDAACKKLIKEYGLKAIDSGNTFSFIMKEKYFDAKIDLRLGKIRTCSINFSFRNYLEKSLYIENTVYLNIAKQDYSFAITIQHDLSIENDKPLKTPYDKRKEEFCTIIYFENNNNNTLQLSYYLNTLKERYLNNYGTKTLLANTTLMKYIIDNFKRPEEFRDTLLITQDLNINENPILNAIFINFNELNKKQHSAVLKMVNTNENNL